MTEVRKQRLIKEYNEPIYLSFTYVVKTILESFLSSNNFKFQISHRAKSKEKLSDKIDRKASSGKYYKTLSEVEDLAGVRVVFYLESDKKRFLNLFNENFENCIISQEEKFSPKGYRGHHIIFRLDDTRSSLIEYQKYKDLKCEIQISSILFHAWSEVEHDIIYKPGGNPGLLVTLGLSELKESFEKLMTGYIQSASIQFDYINEKYNKIRKVGEILNRDFVNDILNAKTNDEIYRTLEIMGEFLYKKPDETLAIIQAAINHAPVDPIILYHFDDRDIFGKSQKDIILKCLGLLESIKYNKPDEVLELLWRLSIYDDDDIKTKSLQVVEKFAKYDFNILTKTKIGYGAQRKILDFILIWNIEKQLQNVDFVEVTLKELLNSSVEGTTSGLNDNADYTITMHSGVVSPTDFLKKIRKEAIDLAYKLYKATEDPKLKLKFVGVLEEATRTPSNVAYGDNVSQMIVDDIKYLSNIYRKIIFGEREPVMTDLLGIVVVIEEHLYWINKSETKRIEESEKLCQDILNDQFYKLFRLLVGDPITYRDSEDIDLAEKTRSQEIKQLIDSIQKEQIIEWFDKLDKIASQHIIVDDWKFNTFKGFLKKLSETKPEIADGILKKAIENNSPLKHFTGSFLDGFRVGVHFDIWDRYTNQIIDAKDIALVTLVVFSLNFNSDVDLGKFIREKDIDLLESITKNTGKLAFLKGVDDRTLHFALFGSLLRLFKRSSERIGAIIMVEIKNNPKYLNMFFSEISTCTYRKYIEIKELPASIIDFLRENIIKLPDLDWHTQELLLEIGQRYGLNSVLGVFMERIQKDAKRKEKKQQQINDERYDAVPYHFNPKLSKFIVEHPEYQEIAGEWLINMSKSWSIYNWHVSHFLRRVGHGFDDLINLLIQRGDDDSLTKAARAMHSLDNANFDLCIEIVRRTNNKKILGLVENNMYSTGVVSGEYGIVEAYESKIKELEKYKVDENKQVKIFVDKMIKSFKENAIRERQRTDEEKQLRKIEFEE